MRVLLAVIADAVCTKAGEAEARIGDWCAAAGLEAVLLRFAVAGPGQAPRESGGAAAPPATLGLVTLGYPEPLGYGERIKLCFDYALEHGLEAVVVLDGDLRYPLETVGSLLAPLRAGAADMVLAVPSGPARAEAAGEAPRFKVQPGARFVSRLLNRISRSRLSGWHCGFRAYRTQALARLPYRYNAASRRFNTEVIIQFLLSGLTVAEAPAPGYAHERLGFGAKVRFGLDMLRASGLSVLHRMSLFYQRQFDLVDDVSAYGLKLGYPSSHTAALARVPDGSRVLDIGCGDGSLARLLKARGCAVRGLDRHDPEAVPGLDGYTRIDLDVSRHAFAASGYDVILLLDVLEHLRRPDALLEHLRRSSPGLPKPRLVISVPNVAFCIVRLRLFCGSFHYGKLGILDLTHTRLFTEASIKALLEQSGYAIEGIAGIPAPFPKAIGLGWLSRAMLAVNGWLIRRNRRLFAYQLVLTAKPRPTLADLARLGEARACPRP
ncbi:MAG: bifunctional glycosyltransferase/class I SAM-dependent methyltransferase [Solidesulfovibrio sp. DCME]|uniref:bifunctional glycosyltransferase/class I SAM-dependent methyltransferase n=1 Tax=Solidesulfovibrio sp. DCME TaxID=3447380 RepID=UPI003D14262C